MKKVKIALMAGILTGGLAFSQDNTLTPEEIEAGWELLFDGTEASLEDWTVWGSDNENNNRDITAARWGVQNGMMTVDRNGSDIRTDRKYSDFVVTMDYQTDGNQGFMYRASLCGSDIWWSAIEVAIDNNTTDIEWTKTPGAAYSLYEPSTNNFKANQINNLTVIAIEDSVEHWHNGEKLLGFKYWSDDFESQFNLFWRTRENNDKPLCFARPYEPGGQPDQTTYASEGYIGLQGNHGGYWQIKNFKILENPVVGCMKPGWTNHNPYANFDYWGTEDCGDTVIVSSVEDMAAQNWYQVQPGNNKLTVSLNHIQNEVDVSVHDIMGQQLEEVKNAQAGNYSFKLEQGIYFIRLKSLSEEITQRVFIQ